MADSINKGIPLMPRNSLSKNDIHNFKKEKYVTIEWACKVLEDLICPTPYEDKVKLQESYNHGLRMGVNCLRLASDCIDNNVTEVVHCEKCVFNEANDGGCNRVLLTTVKNNITGAEETKFITLDFCSYGQYCTRNTSIPNTSEWYYDPNGCDWGIGAWCCKNCGTKNDNLGQDKNINPYIFASGKFCPCCGKLMKKKTE